MNGSVNSRRAILVVDLAFGDCGKGTIVDFLTRHTNAHAVVRFNGGPQAGHNVVTPDGKHHTFSQFGSGTFVPGVRTILSRFMLIEPYALLNEAAHLAQLGVRDAMSRLLIDRRCPVITPPQQAANHLVEIARGDRAFGTCGLGIGQTMQDIIEQPQLTLRAGDLHDRVAIRGKLQAIRDWKVEQLGSVLSALRNESRASQSVDTLLDCSWIDAAVDNYLQVAATARIGDGSEIATALGAAGTTIFEGAQGVLLDETFGFHPHTTWSTTTFANADALLNEIGYTDRRTRIGVLRSYFTRHGPGPFVTEDSTLRAHLPEPHNNDTGWQGRFRVGVFDAVAARYALAVAGGVDTLAVTHMDRLAKLPRQICVAYRNDSDMRSPSEDLFIRDEEKVVGIRPCALRSIEASEQLTRVMNKCRPQFAPLPDDSPEGFLNMVGTELNTPIGILSRGPTARDKRIVARIGAIFG